MSYERFLLELAIAAFFVFLLGFVTALCIFLP